MIEAAKSIAQENEETIKKHFLSKKLNLENEMFENIFYASRDHNFFEHSLS